MIETAALFPGGQARQFCRLRCARVLKSHGNGSASAGLASNRTAMTKAVRMTQEGP